MVIGSAASVFAKDSIHRAFRSFQFHLEAIGFGPCNFWISVIIIRCFGIKPPKNDCN